MLGEMIKLGLLDLSRSVSMLVDLLSDNQRVTRFKAFNELKKLSMSKFSYI